MGLSATLVDSLDCRAIGTALIGQLSGPSNSLGTVRVDVPAAPLQSATSAAGQVDVGPIDGAVQRLVQRIPQALAGLPQADEIVRPLTGVVDLAGQIAANDLPTQFDALLERLQAELQRPGNGGHAALLLRLAQSLCSAPEGQSLAALVRALAPALSTGTAGAFPYLDILRGVEGATQVLGGLMCLETVLAEADRLAATLSVRLDPAAIDHHRAVLAQAVGEGPGSLPDRLDAVDAADAGAVALLADEVVAVAVSLGELRERMATGLGMDEATLAYLDIDRLQAEIDASRTMIRTADVDPASRVTASIALMVAPLMDFDLPGAPAGGLAALIDSAESRVAGLASGLDALDLVFLVGPLTDGLHTLTQPLRELQQLVDSVIVALRSALEQVHAAVAALPLDELADVLRSFLGPVASALDAVRDLLEGVEAALQVAAGAAGSAIGAIDGALDAFKNGIDAFFAEAQTAVTQIDLGGAIAAVAEQVQQFANLLAQAQMKPYFDGAVGAIDAATDVVGAVPFGLLPDSMKADVDAAVQPIRAVDIDAVEQQIETLLGITPDGRFALRGDLEAAIAEVAQKFEAVLEIIEQHHPEVLLADVNTELNRLATQLRAVEPDLTLQPVRAAIDAVQDVVGGLDLQALLQPVNDAFAQITGALDNLSVAELVAPVQQQLDEARARVVDVTRLDRWADALDALRAQTLALLGQVDPQRMRLPLEAALSEVGDTLSRFPAFDAGAGMGAVVAGMLAATGRRIQPSSFGPVLGWMRADPAAASTALAAHSAGVSRSLDRAAAMVDAVDPVRIGTALNGRFARLATAVDALALRAAGGSSARITLGAVRAHLDSATLFGELAAQRARYRAALQAAQARAGAFERSGHSEADLGVAALRLVLVPLMPAGEKLRAVFASLGFTDAQLSVASVVRTLLEAAPPERLVGLVMPLFEALHRRLSALLDAVIEPLRSAAADLRGLLDALDLGPLVTAADGIVAQARSDIMVLSPAQLLAEPLQAFDALRRAIDDDPLATVRGILTALRDQIAGVLEKVDLRVLLAAPLSIYDHILSEVQRIDPTGLLLPVFDQIDQIAGQVDTGLDETVASFKRLQQALPSGGGGSSVSVSGAVTL